MRAWLERHVERRALGVLAGALERLGLGMRPAAGLRPAAADDDAVLDHHGADRGIGPGPAEPAAAERQRKLHEAVIERRIGGRGFGVRGGRGVAHFRAATGGLAGSGLVGAGFGSSSPLSSASACSKSFGSRKFL